MTNDPLLKAIEKYVADGYELDTLRAGHATLKRGADELELRVNSGEVVAQLNGRYLAEVLGVPADGRTRQGRGYGDITIGVVLLLLAVVVIGTRQYWYRPKLDPEIPRSAIAAPHRRIETPTLVILADRATQSGPFSPQGRGLG